MEISTITYLILALVLLGLTFYPRESQSTYFGDWSQLVNYFWGMVFILFTLIWGGIFWW